MSRKGGYGGEFGRQTQEDQAGSSSPFHDVTSYGRERRNGAGKRGWERGDRRTICLPLPAVRCCSNRQHPPRHALARSSGVPMFVWQQYPSRGSYGQHYTILGRGLRCVGILCDEKGLKDEGGERRPSPTPLPTILWGAG